MTDPSDGRPDLSDIDPADAFDDVQPFLTETMSRIAEAYNRRLEREAVGAYMAGYEALDVITPADPYAIGDDHVPALQAGFIPRESADSTPVRLDGYGTKRYDLTDVTPADVDEVRRRWSDDHGQT